MIRKKIFIDQDDIDKFVNIAQKAENDVTLYRGKYAIDAKSLLGVIAIYSKDGLIVEYDKKDIKFEKYLTRFFKLKN